MNYREFGATGLKVSEIGFGGWAIGGQSYGAADRTESLRALSTAEELGCNFVDTAEVYGDSERILGEFLRGRRDRWVVATKYSGQSEGMRRTAEGQLERLGVDAIDYYQIHWAPRVKDRRLYAELQDLKRSGIARFIGVSLYTAADIDYVLDHAQLDGIQLCFNLLEPDPFLARLSRIREAGTGIVVRSALKSGFLTGKFSRTTRFTDPSDLRSKIDRTAFAQILDEVEHFRFLEARTSSLLQASARYPLSFPEVSTVILGTKTTRQAEVNFGAVSGETLDAGTLLEIARVQRQLHPQSSDRSIMRRLWAASSRQIAKWLAASPGSPR